MAFKEELEKLLNKYSMENMSNTPDYILANYMYNCMHSYNAAVSARDKWHSKQYKHKFSAVVVGGIRQCDYCGIDEHTARKNICDTAPFPKCNGANGCDTCEHREEEK